MYITDRRERETGRDYALRTIKTNIVRLELEPGSRVSENELAAEMGLSRTPVREALIELERVRIVEIFPQRGSMISLVDYDLVDEAQFMRVTLECAVIERCCQRGLTPNQRMAMEENLSLQDFYSGKREHRQLELDNDFHYQLFAIAGLTNVYQLMNSMTIHLDRVRTMHLIAAKELKTVEEHHKVLEAILEGNAELAKKIMCGHITHYKADDEIIRSKYKNYIKK